MFRDTDRWTDQVTDGKTHSQLDRHINIQTNRLTKTQTYREMDRYSYKCADMHTDGQRYW